MMTREKGTHTLVINVNVEIPATALQAIVANAKKIAGHDQKGIYRIDTADKVSQVISKFLLETDFETYAKDIQNCM